jgi:hypothetical protein
MDHGKWAHTSLMCSIIAEPNRDRKSRAKPYGPDDFNPWAKPKKPPVITGKELQSIFCGGR